MTPAEQKEIQDVISPYIAAAIKENVNGKMDTMQKQMDVFLQSFYEASKSQVAAMKRIEDKFDNYVKDDMKWKETAAPVIEMGQNVRGFGKVALYFLAFVAAISGAVLGLINLFKKE